MNTQENNKMIAEFMGLIIRDKEGNLPTSSQQHKLFIEEEWDKLYLASPYSPNGPDYHKDWYWLMPVVEKMNTTELWDEYDISHLATYLVSVDKNATYKAVVEFINQYNKTK